MNKSKNTKGNGKFLKKLYYKNSAQNLMAYKAVSGLDAQFERSTQKFPAAIKMTECYKVHEFIHEALYLITAAQEAAENPLKRVEHLHSAVNKIKMVELMVREFLNRKLLKATGFSAISLLEDDAIRQLEGWMYSTIAAINKDTVKSK